MPVAWSGHRLMLSAFLACVMLLCGAPTPVSAAPATAGVRPGIAVFLDDVPAALRGKRVGLITNNTGIDRSGTSDIDLIAASDDLTLVALLAPEHGIRGTAEAGVTVGDGVDAKTGVPIYSLYGAQGHSPTPAMLKDVDVLVYDLQEVGGRTWTYVSTMALSMQAAARKGIPFVVLDRPNPIGGVIVEGALLDPAYASFIGMYPIPARHGMTVGELATLFNRQQGIGADLTVVPAQGWRRAQWFDQTGLPWVNPSPQPPIAGGRHELPRHGVLRGHQPLGGPRDRPALRADWGAVAGCSGGSRDDERVCLAGHRLRGRHRLGRRGRRQISRTKHPGHPVSHHRSAGIPTGRHGAAAH